MLQNTHEILNSVLFLLPGKTFTERSVYVGVLRLDRTSHAKMHFVMETQHTDCSHHCKDFIGKERNILLLLLRIRKTFLRYLQKRQRMQYKLQRWKAVKIVSEGCSHCSKAHTSERKKNRSRQVAKAMLGQKKAAIE